MGVSSDTNCNLFALYHLRTGFCRRRDLVKAQFDDIAKEHALDLVWGRAAYATGALGTLINKVGIFNSMFFRVARAGSAGQSSDGEDWNADLVKDRVAFMTHSRHVEGWVRIYLYLCACDDSKSGGSELSVLPSQGLEIGPLLLDKIERRESCILDLDPAPCPTCGV